MRPFISAFLALSVAAPSPAQETVPQIDVTLADFSFTPRTIHLNAGQKIKLHLANKGSGGHNFAAPDFFAAAVVEAASVPHINKGKVEVKKGKIVEITLAPSAGRYRLKCTHFLHSGFGMKGEIVVE